MFHQTLRGHYTSIGGKSVTGLAAAFPSDAGKFAITGDESLFFNNDDNNLTALGGTGSAVVAHDFIYGGTSRIVTLQGLTPGAGYVVSLLSVGFDDPPTTRVVIFASSGQALAVDQDQFGNNNGVRVDHAFTADAATRVITLTPQAAGTFHLYGLALRQGYVVTNANNSGPGSLRQALADAAASAGADLITFVAALDGATVTLGSEISIDDTAGVTVDASSLPAGVTIDGGAGTNRIFSVGSGKNLALLGLTLTGGNGSGAVQNGNGGAIANFGTLALTRCTLSGNTRASGSGGAILNDGGALTLTQCTLTGNSTTNGGAIFQTTGALTLTQCTFAGNAALINGDGGAIFNQGGTATLTHCTFSGNLAPINGGDGGAIGQNGGTLTLTHCTLSGNQAENGGGIHNFSGSLTLTNSIVAGNTATSIGPDIFNSSTLTPSGVNFIGNTAGSTLTPGPAILTGTPLLAPLGNYGGPTQTRPPLPGSPAIDAGSDASASGLTTDQRGRPRLASAHVDIGAVELQTPFLTVTNTADDLSAGSLRAVIGQVDVSATLAFAVSGNVITLSAAQGQITVNKNLIIDASTLPTGLAIAGGGASGTFRLFSVASGSDFTLRGLTLANGGGSSNPIGGAISNDGTLTLTQCTLTGNSANARGGAIFNSGTLTLTRCTLTGNSSNANGGAILNNGTLTLTQCILSGNSALSDRGGAIFNDGALTLTHCTLSGNSTRSGGAIYSSTSSITGPVTTTATLRHCTLTGNTATTRGGAIHNQNGRTTLTHCTVSGNTAPAGQGSGVSSYGDSDTETVVENSIIAGNTNSSVDFVDAGANSFSSQGRNLIGSGNATGDFPTPDNLIDNAPLLAPLGGYGGPTQTMALLPGSPARNAAAVLSPAIASDQRGFPIVGPPDIGAYEAGTFTNYTAWAYETLPATATPAQRALDFDLDRDGRSNLLEYATLTDGGTPTGGTILGFTRNPAGTLATLVMPYRYSATGLFYHIQRTTDLTGTWTDILTVNSATFSGANIPGVTFITSDNVSLTFTDNFITGQPRVFYRMKAMQQ